MRRHLETAPSARPSTTRSRRLPGLLSLAGGAEKAAAEPLSPAFEERLLDAYARDNATPPRRRLRWRMPRPRWLAVGAVGAAGGRGCVAVAVTGEEQEPARQLRRLVPATSAARRRLAPARTSRATTRAPRSTCGSAASRATRTPSTRSCATRRSGRRPPAPSAPTRGAARTWSSPPRCARASTTRSGSSAAAIARTGASYKRDVLTARLS